MITKAQDITLFLVEDDDVDAMSIERCFTKQRIANPMLRATDGIEALEMLRGGAVIAPYIILLDLQMPRMGGIEFLKEIRNDPKLNCSVIFVLTTSKCDEDIVASYTKHIAGYFLKERSGEEFLDIVKLLEGYWKIAQLPVSCR